jgi:hypothetical protein
MAEKRMFSKKIIFSDMYYSISDKAKSLYIYFLAEADDDGFVDSVRSIMNISNAKNKHLDELIKNNLVILMNSNLILISHWKVHNTIRPDRYHETLYQKEKRSVMVDSNNVYVTHPHPFLTDI